MLLQKNCDRNGENKGYFPDWTKDIVIREYSVETTLTIGSVLDANSQAPQRMDAHTSTEFPNKVVDLKLKSRVIEKRWKERDSLKAEPEKTVLMELRKSEESLEKLMAKGSHWDQTPDKLPSFGCTQPTFGKTISDVSPSCRYKTVPLEQFVPGCVSVTSKKAGEDFVKQLMPSESTQGCIWERDLRVNNGQYAVGVNYDHESSVYQCGSFGKGIICIDKDSQKKFFKKEIPKDKFQPNEVLIPNQLNCTNVVKMFGVIQQGNIIAILMEYAGTSLNKFVAHQPRMDITLIWNIMKQVLSGLNELDKKGIVHLDIKPDNVCIHQDNNGSYKALITDFGASNFMNQQLKLKAFTLAYLAPEACRRVLLQTEQNYLEQLSVGNRSTDITGKADVFSLGLTGLFMFYTKHVLLYEVVHGKEKQRQDIQLLEFLAVSREPAKCFILEKWPKEMQTLLSGMLSGSPDERFSAGEALAYIEHADVKKKLRKKILQNGKAQKIVELEIAAQSVPLHVMEPDQNSMVGQKREHEAGTFSSGFKKRQSVSCDTETVDPALRSPSNPTVGKDRVGILPDFSQLLPDDN